METTTSLQQFFMFMGPWKWVMILLAITVAGFILNGFYQYIIRNSSTKHALNNILFWGIITLCAGFIGQITGIWQALTEIMKAQDISPPIVLIGFMSTFTTTLFGLIVFVISALFWWGLKFRWQKLNRTA
ncbi:MAG: MotA/TolQ/ExbB proton channel family protein [Bacteroidetes bacterium]|nr:MotA/TolQ/ExbB proton channel family protein [Bacteroidota bacterium]